jgi:hypothetical protein
MSSVIAITAQVELRLRAKPSENASDNNRNERARVSEIGAPSRLVGGLA